LGEWKGNDRDSLELRDFEHNLEFIKATTQTAFYQTISQKLPKGVIHHFHWSAAHTSDNIYQCVINYLNNPTSKNSIIVKVEMFKPDKAELKSNKTVNAKEYSTVPSPKIYIFTDFKDAIAKYYKEDSENFKNFKKNLIYKYTHQCRELTNNHLYIAISTLKIKIIMKKNIKLF